MAFSISNLLLVCVSALVTTVRASDADSCDDGHGIRLADASKEFAFSNSTAIKHFDDPQWLLFNGPIHRFNITWRCADPSFPVLLQWTINDADHKPDVRWGLNLTGVTDEKLGNGTFWWSPSEALSSATFTPNATADEVRVQASMNWNIISVSQPQKDTAVISETNRFILQPDQILKFLQSQYKLGTAAEYNKWMMAVIPAVIVGILIFSLASVAIGYTIKKRQAYKRHTRA